MTLHDTRVRLLRTVLRNGSTRRIDMGFELATKLMHGRSVQLRK